MYSHDHVWLHSLPSLPPQSFMQIEKAFRFDNASVIVTPYFCFGSLLVCMSSLTIHLHHPFDHTCPPPPPGPGECPLEITVENHASRNTGILHSGDHLSCGHPPPIWNTARWYQAGQLYAQEHNVSAVGGVRSDVPQPNKQIWFGGPTMPLSYFYFIFYFFGRFHSL